jgi:hypothetical protein
MSKSFFDTNVLIFLLPFFQPFSMESLNKAMAEAKRPRSIQDVLMEQMAKIGGLGSGGNGGNKNRYGRGGGGSDGPEDESFKESLYEMIQILIATVAFILVVTSSLHFYQFIVLCYIFR